MATKSDVNWPLWGVWEPLASHQPRLLAPDWLR
jgi:hypothetical protein